MGRPREFDADTALQDIIEIFWAQGFDGTSFADLERATGLRKASLFAAFGDKHTIFSLALERYQQERCSSFAALLTANRSPRKALKAWLLAAAGRMEQKSCSRGCFATNALIEMAPHDKKCAQILSCHREKMETLLESLVAQGIEAEEFSGELKPRTVARYLLCVVVGIQALSRAPEGCCRSEKELTGMIDLILGSLE